jgi:hypothetical protein
MSPMSTIVSFPKWEKQFRAYTDSGIDTMVAWQKTNKFFGMAKERTKAYEELAGITL